MINHAEIKRMKRKLEKARAEGLIFEVREVCNDLAAYYSEYEKYEEALSYYQESLSISEAKGGLLDVAIAKRMIAETLCSLGRYEEAVKFTDYYIQHALALKNKIEEQRGYATKGRICFCWAEFLANSKRKFKQKKCDEVLQKSLKAYNKSLEICQDLTNIDVAERSEMKSRLLQNLGLALGLSGDFKEAHNFFTSAIQLNKHRNCKESLFWCYLNQGEVFLKAGEPQNACLYYDYAAKVSVSSDKTMESMKCKVKALFLCGDFLAAKRTLRSLYRQKHGKDTDVFHQLQLAVYICNIEKKLNNVKENDYEIKKKLYENLGDACCAVKNYKKGIESYLNMLDCAEKAGNSDKELVPCYTSLSQTYKDNKEYGLALTFCEKELKVLQDAPYEASKTYLFIGELYEFLEYDYDEIYGAYKKAQELAEEAKDVEQQILVLKNIIDLQKEFGHLELAKENERLIESTKKEFGIDSDAESDGEMNTEPFNFESDIDVGDLFSDDEMDKVKNRVKRGAYKLKKNEKGETELHTVVIKGNFRKAELLINNGHPVNEKDSAGWTVLHEACNHGHTQIVELLLKHGADINNPGGKECGGLTPLHDAAENGHLDIIELLLKNGASTAVLTDNGDSPLECLKRWRRRVNLNDEELEHYERVCNQLRCNLDSIRLKKKREKLIADVISGEDNDSVGKFIEYCESNSRKDVSCFNSIESSVPKKISAPKMYQSAIEAVGRRPEVSREVERVESCEPLVPESAIDEDWLIDDLGGCEKPPKRRKINGSFERTHSKDVFEDEWDDALLTEEVDELMEHISLSEEVGVQSTVQRDTSPVKRQIHCVEKSPKTPETVMAETPKHSDLIKIKVKILGQLFLIPLVKSKADDLTIEWLAEEATKRYKEVNEVIPKLLIMTSEGAILSKSDPVTTIIGENVIETKVVNWNGQSLAETYREECGKIRLEPRSNVCVCSGEPDSHILAALELQKFDNSILLRDFSFGTCELKPLFRTFQLHQLRLNVLDLSRNVLGDEGMVHLMPCLKTCFIEKLYLICNNITIKGIRYLSEALEESPQDHLTPITLIDFSFNPIGDESIPFLRKIAANLQNLKMLRVEHCDFTQKTSNICET